MTATPMVPVFATLRYPDGTTRNAKFWPDQRGIRVYARVGTGRDIELIDSWPDATISSVKDRRTQRFTITLTGDKIPAGVTLEHWGECLGCTRNPLKGFRAPTPWET